ncbi:NUDIX hydrolase [Schaalia sp. 19OD2882]|uniref:NUDIX hydrolase n=1 Tax=Schaalia sp. 19OD2882 TaxID=2794089 RepID=UPI0020A786F3|nr:NUDIX domain-containing protein [Schaalia sp. 19OD2882]
MSPHDETAGREIEEALSALGPEWPLDQDGYPHREAARVVLFDRAGRLLLARGHDAAQPGRSWWFTIGGGLVPGEDPRAGAVRELQEETGLHVPPEELEGPVLFRKATFDFLTVTARQEEWFFVARLDTWAPDTHDEGWTDLERDVIDEQRWWDLDDLAALSARAEVYPRGLVAMARQWSRGWDGVLDVVEETSI